MMYDETIKDIKAGKYGDEWEQLALSNDHIAVDAERYLYVCGKCGNWAVEYGLSLYVPESKGEPVKPCIMIEDIRKHYRILKRRVHHCEKCGSVMHKATPREAENLPCPECGGAPEKEKTNRIMWD